MKTLSIIITIISFQLFLFISGCDNTSKNPNVSQDTEQHQTRKSTEAPKKSPPNQPPESSKPTNNTQNSTPQNSQNIPPPSEWISTQIKNPPTLSEQQLWDNILTAIKPLIIARNVTFAPLGSSNTSLTHQKNDFYKAKGRCIVTENTGKKIAYEFECIAIVNKFEAQIISINFNSSSQ